MDTGSVSVRRLFLLRRVLESRRLSRNLRFIAAPRFPGGGRPPDVLYKLELKEAGFSPEAGLTAHGLEGCEMRATSGTPGAAPRVLPVTSLLVGLFVQLSCKRRRTAEKASPGPARAPGNRS